MKGTAGVLVPKQIEVELNMIELIEYIKENKDIIIWDDKNKQLLE